MQRPVSASLEEIEGGDGDGVEAVRPFDGVPDHLLVSLFRHLNVRERLRVEGVCRRWLRVALDAAWTHVRAVDLGTLVADGSLSSAPFGDAESSPKRQARGILEAVVERADLRDLNVAAFRPRLSYVCFISAAFVARVCSLCPALTKLDVSGVRLTNSVLCTIGAKLGGRLRSLSISRCFETADFDQGLGSLFADCTELECLDVSHNWGVTGTSSFAALPVTLKTLNVEGFRNLSNAALRRVGERCSVLDELKIDYITTWSSAVIQQHLDQLCCLRSLKLTHCVDLEDNFTAVGRLANLQRLEFRYTLISDQTLRAVVTGCKQLRTVMLSESFPESLRLTNAGIGALARLPNLTRLQLKYYAFVTDAPLIAIAQRGQLEVLSVDGCSKITDAAMQSVASSCRALRCLHAQFCSRVGDATLLALLQLVQRRVTADALHVWLRHTAATQPAVVAHANLIVNFGPYNYGCKALVDD